MRSAYDRAWTCFWWYDDFVAFNKAYDLVEELAQGNSQITYIELLQNLWQLLYSSVMCEQIDAAAGRLVERTALLKGELKRLQLDPGRPSAAAHARTAQLLMRLTEAHDNAEELKKILNEFRRDLELCAGLVDFPAQQFIDILMELGEYFPTDEAFDETFESLLETARQRESSVVAGRMLLQRGVQKLKGEKPYAAIRLLGRAQQDLALHETRGEMVMALGLCGSAYERVGLLWAARGSLLLAANQAMKAFWEDGEITGTGTCVSAESGLDRVAARTYPLCLSLDRNLPRDERSRQLKTKNDRHASTKNGCISMEPWVCSSSRRPSLTSSGLLRCRISWRLSNWKCPRWPCCTR